MKMELLYLVVFLAISLVAVFRSRLHLREHQSSGGYGRPPIGAALIAGVFLLFAGMMGWSLIFGFDL
jgi:hypothetical protein